MQRFIMNHRFWFIGGAFALVLMWWWRATSTDGKKDVSLTRSSVDIQVDTGQTAAVSAETLFNQARKAMEEKKLLEAKAFYRQIYLDHPNFERIQQVQAELEALNLNILFSNLVVPEDTVIHEVVSGDTLGKLAKKYQTTIELIKKSNHLKSDVIRIGQRLRIWTASFNIYVDKTQNVLMVRKGNEVFKVYRVSTGRGASTPAGEFTINSRLEDPVWFNRGVVVPPDSPANVLGTRWLGFDIPGYGIHGTIEPETIGQQVTEGCVRMRNEEIEELYVFIPRGTKVVVVD